MAKKKQARTDRICVRCGVQWRGVSRKRLCPRCRRNK